MSKKAIIVVLIIAFVGIGYLNAFSLNTIMNNYLEEKFGMKGVFNGPDAEETGIYGPPTPEEYRASQVAWAWHDFLHAVAMWWWLIVVGILFILLLVI